MTARLRVVLGALVTTVVASATIGCAHSGVDRLSIEPYALIQMRHGGCFPNVCPVYSVSIFRDGTVVYDGAANVSVLGRRIATLSQERLEAILSQIDAMDVSGSLEQCCACRGTAQRSHLVILDYRPGPTVETVLSDERCSLAPPAMNALERSIDAAAGVGPWTSGPLASRN